MTEGIERVCCPKCGGKIFFDRDSYGWYEKCLYCGWLRDLPGIELNTSDKLRRGGRSRPVEKEETTGPTERGSGKPPKKQ
jgi:hypothetical protein